MWKLCKSVWLLRKRFRWLRKDVWRLINGKFHDVEAGNLALKLAVVYMSVARAEENATAQVCDATMLNYSNTAWIKKKSWLTS